MFSIKLILASLVLGTTVFAASARENWDENCARCHGAKGDGHTDQRTRLGIKDYTDPKIQAEFADAGLLKNLLLGIQGEDGKVRMPAFKEKVTVAEAKELIALIRSFKK